MESIKPPEITVIPTTELRNMDGVICRKWELVNGDGFLFVKVAQIGGPTELELLPFLTSRDPNNPQAAAVRVSRAGEVLREVAHIEYGEHAADKQ